MATRTLGTNSTTTLTAIQFTASVSDADFATLINGIKDDYNTNGQFAPGVNTQPSVQGGSGPTAVPRLFPGAFSRQGLLIVPNRGVLKVFPGDFVAFDATGWPILVSGAAINTVLNAPNNVPASSWTHT